MAATYRQLIRDTLDDTNYGPFDDEATSVEGLLPDTPSFQMARWVADAWVHIQTIRPDWTFMRKEFAWRPQARTESDPPKTQYAPSELRNANGGPSVPDWGRWYTANVTDAGEREGETGSWVLKGPNIGYGDLPFLPWTEFRRRYIFAEGQQDEYPLAFSIDPQGNVHISPAPATAEYDVYGDYRRAPQELKAFDDTLEGFPDRYSRLVRYRAALFYYLYDEAAPGRAAASEKFKSMFNSAQLELTPTTRQQGSFIGI